MATFAPHISKITKSSTKFNYGRIAKTFLGVAGSAAIATYFYNNGNPFNNNNNNNNNNEGSKNAAKALFEPVLVPMSKLLKSLKVKVLVIIKKFIMTLLPRFLKI